VRSRLQRAAAAASLATLLVAGCSDDDGDLEAFCAAATDTAGFDDLFEDLEPRDVEEATATFRAALETEEALRADAPDAVRPDIDVLVRFFDDLVEGLEQVEPGSDERPAVYDELRSRFDQVEAASTRITTYVETNC
jgi:hypothetical protein